MILEAMKQALEALEELDGWDTATQGDLVVCTDAIEPLRAAIEQMENAEPAVLWNVGVNVCIPDGTPLYTHPAPAIPAGWQPIETAPKDEEVFIGAFIDGEFVFGRSMCFYERGNEFEGEFYQGWVWSIDDCSDSVAEAPTHWMPLPQPPKE